MRIIINNDYLIQYNKIINIYSIDYEIITFTLLNRFFVFSFTVVLNY